jgi:hypothetical protein
MGIESQFIKSFVNKLSGGSPDTEGRFKSVLRLRSSELILGSAVLIESGWALCVAHCVGSFPDDLFVESPLELIKIPVARIHWKGREPFNVGGGDPWPNGVENLSDETDELILLELASPFSALRTTASLSLTQPKIGDSLSVAGYGENGRGVYTDLPNTADTNLWCKCGKSKLYAMVPDFDARNPGMPQSDDSGASIFFPMPGNPQRLVGLHVSRSAASLCCKDLGTPPSDDDEVARFLPIDTAAIKWIADVTSKTKFNSLSSSATAAGSRKFCLRKVFSCSEFDDASRLSNGANDAWYLDAVAGRVHFKKCDEVVITRTSGTTAEMALSRSGAIKYSATLIANKSAGATQFEWMEGVDKGKNNLTFYLYAYRSRILKGSIVRGIRIEVFDDSILASELTPKKRPSEPGVICRNCVCEDDPSNVVPDCKNFEVGELARVRPLLPSAVIVDQDDEGNGHNAPR